MQTRSAELTAFLASLHSAITERALRGSGVRQVTEKIMHALQVEQPSNVLTPVWLPVCECLDDAVDRVVANDVGENPDQSVRSSTSLVDHALALRDLSQQLAWWHRTQGVEPESSFATGHANATVIGKGGLEERDDVWVGISLMAPGIQYPEHHHPPEEVYLVLSRGHWQQDGGAFFEPGIGELVHNTPNVLHAMRSSSVPLLATWCLWKGHDEQRCE